ncbi:MAG TPA: LegC family aminotransferase [Roseobacter sp.]|uniref:Aminotransferase DegT n=1 Tax=marine sediment metagenome TaxID=412755 RepID=A0A0F9WBL6_9ZZZZ|nr:LegC family aminotransferase [Roseobacter sp.]|tara:strand:+ start:2672 stop:3838 length:1167 start_codon:yes stop_codon:yes gene_type:complete
MFDPLIAFIRDQYQTNDPIPLHAPTFGGNERIYVDETITSTFVSSVGRFVDRFEADMASYTGSPRAVAVMNGTAGLHMALMLAGVARDEYVITQALTFVATCNAISYCGATPIFVDVDHDTMGLSPTALEAWLEQHADQSDDGLCRYKADGKVIRACVPMHSFGHPVHLHELVRVCKTWGLVLVEDAAESLGSTYHGQHTGTFGAIGVASFNGNKTITTGGGGMILCSEALGNRAKHLTTTAKKPHSFEYVHDAVGYNFRMPNLNAALGCAQLEQLPGFVAAKRALAAAYRSFFADSSLSFFSEPSGCESNYWLNAVICSDRAERDRMLEATNSAGIMTRPIWALMTRLPMYDTAPRSDELTQSNWFEDRVVNLPSSVIPGLIPDKAP